MHWEHELFRRVPEELNTLAVDVAMGLFLVCLNAKSRGAHGVQQAELSRSADSENNPGGSSEKTCATSAETFTRRRSAMASKMSVAGFTNKDRFPPRAQTWIAG